MVVKRFIDWENVFLDTSVIIALFGHQSQGLKDEDSFVKTLISYLAKNPAQNRKPRRFLVSTISISEILSHERDIEKIKKIMGVLDTDNVEFIDFDLNTALLFNSDLYEHLSKKNIHAFAAEIGFKTGEYGMAREWISRDYMIIQSAKNAAIDIVLTLDKKTFLPIATKIGVACACCYSKNFNAVQDVVISFNGNEHH